MGKGAIPNPLLFEGRLCLGGREEPATRNVGAGMREKWPPLANGDPALVE
jgi:hypothetical protein